MKLGLLVMTLLLAAAGQASANAVRSAPPQCNGQSQAFSRQALVYPQTGFGGNCWVLDMGGTSDQWTAWDASLGFPNDTIRSVKVGPDVTLVLFWRNFYTQDNGAANSFGPGSLVSNLGSWNGQASAARVQRFAANSCDISTLVGPPDHPFTDFMALFTDANYTGDCNAIVIGFGRCYADPLDMGFRNDSMSSIHNFSSVYEATLFENSNYGKLIGWADQQNAFNLSILGDRISSIGGDVNHPCQ